MKNTLKSQLYAECIMTVARRFVILPRKNGQKNYRIIKRTVN